MEQDEMAQVFEEWNKGELDSFLIEITRDILKFKDSDGQFNVYCICLLNLLFTFELIIILVDFFICH